MNNYSLNLLIISFLCNKYKFNVFWNINKSNLLCNKPTAKYPKIESFSLLKLKNEKFKQISFQNSIKTTLPYFQSLERPLQKKSLQSMIFTYFSIQLLITSFTYCHLSTIN